MKPHALIPFVFAVYAVGILAMLDQHNSQLHERRSEKLPTVDLGYEVHQADPIKVCRRCSCPFQLSLLILLPLSAATTPAPVPGKNSKNNLTVSNVSDETFCRMTRATGLSATFRTPSRPSASGASPAPCLSRPSVTRCAPSITDLGRAYARRPRSDGGNSPFRRFCSTGLRDWTCVIGRGRLGPTSMATCLSSGPV